MKMLKTFFPLLWVCVRVLGCLLFIYLSSILPYPGQVAKYMQNTHAKTHSNYTVDIVQLFRVSREGEVDRFGKVNYTTKNHFLLVFDV